MTKDIEGMTEKLFAASVFDSSYMDAEYAESQFCKALAALTDEEYEPQMTLPLEFTCNCGEHMIRHDIYGGMSRFFCSKCKAEWLVGSQEV